MRKRKEKQQVTMDTLLLPGEKVDFSKQKRPRKQPPQMTVMREVLGPPVEEEFLADDRRDRVAESLKGGGYEVVPGDPKKIVGRPHVRISAPQSSPNATPVLGSAPPINVTHADGSLALKLRRVPVGARRHLHFRLGHTPGEPAAIPVGADLRGAVVKITVSADPGAAVPLDSLREQATRRGAVHVAPIVPAISSAPAPAPLAALPSDPAEALRAWAEEHPVPAGAADPFELLKEIL